MEEVAKELKAFYEHAIAAQTADRAMAKIRLPDVNQMLETGQYNEMLLEMWKSGMEDRKRSEEEWRASKEDKTSGGRRGKTRKTRRGGKRRGTRKPRKPRKLRKA